MNRGWLSAVVCLALGCAPKSAPPDAGIAPDAGSQAGSDAGFDAGSNPTDAGPFHPGPHAPLPQIPFNGGYVIQHVQLVTVTFADSVNRADVEALGDWLVTSDWLHAIGADYGLADGTHVAKVGLAQNAPATTSDQGIQAWLAQEIQIGAIPGPPGAFADGGLDAGSGDAGPAQPSDFVYALYYPPTTRIALNGFGQISCGTGAGYHSEALVGARRVATAIVVGCPPGTAANLGVSELVDVESGISHEIAEAMTDPYYGESLGWAISDANVPQAWGGGEIGDLCTGLNAVESAFTVQRIWSNSAAADGGDPCLPTVPGEPYFGVTATPALAQPVPAGRSFTFTLQAWSAAPFPAWNLAAYATSLGVLDTRPVLSANHISNGEQATLTLTLPANGTSQQVGHVYVLSTNPNAPGDLTGWPVVVYVP